MDDLPHHVRQGLHEGKTLEDGKWCLLSVSCHLISLRRMKLYRYYILIESGRTALNNGLGSMWANQFRLATGDQLITLFSINAYNIGCPFNF